MTTDDVELLLRIVSDAVAMAYDPRTKDEGRTRDWIAWTLRNYQEYGSGLWSVERKDDGEFLGQCGHLGTESLVSLPDSRNQPAIRVAQRGGWRFGNGLSGITSYGISREEWSKRPSSRRD
jgi:hypothetical protein